MSRLLFLVALIATPACGQALVVTTCGTGAFAVGTLHQLTMDPAGYLCVSTTTTAAAGAQAKPPDKPAPKPDEPKK